eukprot:gene10930-biopygen15371
MYAPHRPGLNVHYSPFFNRVAAFSPVLLSAGGVWEGAEVAAEGAQRRGFEMVGLGASVGRPRAGGWRRGVRFFTNSAVARSFRPLFASSRRDANRPRRAQSVAR